MNQDDPTDHNLQAIVDLSDRIYRQLDSTTPDSTTISLLAMVRALARFIATVPSKNPAITRATLLPVAVQSLRSRLDDFASGRAAK